MNPPHVSPPSVDCRRSRRWLAALLVGVVLTVGVSGFTRALVADATRIRQEAQEERAVIAKHQALQAAREEAWRNWAAPWYRWHEAHVWGPDGCPLAYCTYLHLDEEDERTPFLASHVRENCMEEYYRRPKTESETARCGPRPPVVPQRGRPTSDELERFEISITDLVQWAKLDASGKL